MTATAQRRTQAPRKEPANSPDQDAVLLIPEWVTAWGWVPLALAGLVLALISYAIGARNGAASGWTVFLSVSVTGAALGTWDYLRRLRRRRARRQRELSERSEFSRLDAMTWRELEYYCADLLTVLGYTDVEVIGSRPDEGGLDILATSPDGTPVGVQVKHRKPNPETGKLAPLGPDKVRELFGTVTGRQYAGRQGILMTNTHVQPAGRQFARENGITILDRREGLGDWMNQARSITTAAEGVPRRMHPETRAVLGIAGAAAIAVLTVTLSAQVAGPRPAPVAAPTAARAAATAATSPRSPGPPSASPGRPVQVVREFYAAVSSHDWPRVWQLGGRNLGQGPYATYDGMISGYRSTIRDVLTEIRATGDTVTGRFVAYQSGGAARPYLFTYVVRNGVIVSGRQQQG